MKKKKRRPVTLIEIMIVIVLIGLIGGALAFNMSGSVEKGRLFKTEQNRERIKDILLLEAASSGVSVQDLLKDHRWDDIVNNSPLAKKNETIFDGWKKKFSVSASGDEIKINAGR